MAMIFGNDGYQFFRGDVVHIKLHGAYFLKVSGLLCDTFQFFRFGISLGDLVFDCLLPAFQDTFLHLPSLHRSGILFVVLGLVIVDRLQHEMQDG